MVTTVPAYEFTQNFGRYRTRPKGEAIAVSSDGEITGYFVGADDYEELLRYRSSRRIFLTTDLSPDQVAAIGASKMDDRHAHLDAMLDPDS